MNSVAFTGPAERSAHGLDCPVVADRNPARPHGNERTRLAARDDRTLSEYVYRVLQKHVFGHVPSLMRDPSESTDFGALHCDVTVTRGDR